MKLIDLHVFERRSDGLAVITTYFHGAFSSMEKTGIADTIKKECKDGLFAVSIRLGGCLRLFGVSNDDMFHCLNLVMWSIDLGLTRVTQCKVQQEWIDYCFPIDNFDESTNTIQDNIEKFNKYRKF